MRYAVSVPFCPYLVSGNRLRAEADSTSMIVNPWFQTDYNHHPLLSGVDGTLPLGRLSVVILVLLGPYGERILANV